MTDTTDPVERAAREIAAVRDWAYHWDELAERLQNDYREAARKAFRVFGELPPPRTASPRAARLKALGAEATSRSQPRNAWKLRAERIESLAPWSVRVRAGDWFQCVECHMPALIHVVFTATPDQKVGNGVYAGDSYCSLACLAKGALRIPLPEHEDEDDT